MFACLRQDIQRYQEHTGQALLTTFCKALYCHPSFAGVVWYRTSRALWLKKHNMLAQICLIILRVFYPFIRNYSGVELSPSVEIGPGLWIGHFGPTVFHPQIKAGRHLSILHGTTIGSGTGGVPILGDNVSVGTGTIIVGAIRVGDNVIIGAGAVVTKDIPDNCLAIGSPAKAFPRHGQPGERTFC